MDTIIDKFPVNTGWFDIIEVKNTSTPIIFRNNRIHSIANKNNSGFGIRLNINKRTGFSYTNDKKNLELAVNRAVAISNYGEIEQFELPSDANKSFNPYNDKIKTFNIKNEIREAEESINEILSHFPEANIDLKINNSKGSMKIINSKGIDLSYNNSYYSISISVTYIPEPGNKIDIWESKSSQYPVTYKEINKRIIKKIDSAVKSRKTQSGVLPVILTPKALSNIIGIVISGLNARSVWKGISPFAEKTGEKMFNSKLHIKDDPQLKNSPYSFPFDDEGVTSRKKNLIKKGIIKNFITDLKYAHRLGIEPSGNGSRGYSSLPSPSYSNILIDSGDKYFSDIVKDVKKGILADQFIGLGQSNTLTGDFSANLDLAYLIENGEITGRVKDCMISDNIFKLLSGDIIISKERETYGSSLAPYILFPEVNYLQQVE